MRLMWVENQESQMYIPKEKLTRSSTREVEVHPRPIYLLKRFGRIIQMVGCTVVGGAGGDKHGQDLMC